MVTSTINVAGATAATFTIPAVSFTDNTRTFRCILTGCCTVVISSIATLYVNPGGASYAEYKNNVLIYGATGSSLTGLTLNDIGTYKLLYSDPNG
jgi:hypothetical protein